MNRDEALQNCMSSRQALQKAWYDQSGGRGNMTNPIYECGFVEGFNIAWEMLLSEIRPLVADLTHVPRGCTRHFVAVERLRELVRELEERE